MTGHIPPVWRRSAPPHPVPGHVSRILGSRDRAMPHHDHQIAGAHPRIGQPLTEGPPQVVGRDAHLPAALTTTPARLADGADDLLHLLTTEPARSPVPSSRVEHPPGLIGTPLSSSRNPGVIGTSCDFRFFCRLPGITSTGPRPASTGWMVPGISHDRFIASPIRNPTPTSRGAETASSLDLAGKPSPPRPACARIPPA